MQLSDVMDDQRIISYDPLVSPDLLQSEIPISAASLETIRSYRKLAGDVVCGRDDRLLVICGPCSIHDTKSALEYAARLKEIAAELSSNLVIVMSIGWKGMINDPDMNDSFKINKTDSGVAVGCELLDTISPQFIAGLQSWSAIGARTTECQLHRELASGVSFPVGFKNGTDGGVGIAIDAIRSAAHPHHFLGVTKQGLAAITNTTGNSECHVILRGGKQGTNYDKESIGKVRASLEAQKSAQVAGGDESIGGVMIESHLFESAQKIPADLSELKYGVSVTDACVHWDDTVLMLRQLSDAVVKRRETKC